MNQFSNVRHPSETKEQYHARLKTVRRAVKIKLQRGAPAKGYVNGPHPTHKPHDVTQKGMILSPAGVPKEHTWTVRHPGTLVKVPA